MTLKEGATLQNGKYVIKRVLGQGGFGITYYAEHTLLGINVAIKEFFFKQFCDRDQTTSRVSICTSGNVDEVKRYEEKFIKEARIIAKLDHPNIIKIHDVFRENNTAYYVMDFIDGDNLLNIVTRCGSIPENKALGYIRQVGEALEYIHNMHLNHLDVKPANLMLRNDNDRVLLIDFGMSKQYDTISGNQTSTTPVGISHGYAPFEQYKEGGVGNFSPQTDIYALGATLFKLVSGKTPPQACDIINEGLPEFPSTISKKTKDAISKAMGVRKNSRQNSVEEFLNMLPNSSTKKEINEETLLVPSNDKSDNDISFHPDDDRTEKETGSLQKELNNNSDLAKHISDKSESACNEVEELCLENQKELNRSTSLSALSISVLSILLAISISFILFLIFKSFYSYTFALLIISSFTTSIGIILILRHKKIGLWSLLLGNSLFAFIDITYFIDEKGGEIPNEYPYFLIWLPFLSFLLLSVACFYIDRKLKVTTTIVICNQLIWFIILAVFKGFTIPDDLAYLPALLGYLVLIKNNEGKRDIDILV